MSFVQTNFVAENLERIKYVKWVSRKYVACVSDVPVLNSYQKYKQSICITFDLKHNCINCSWYFLLFLSFKKLRQNKILRNYNLIEILALLLRGF